MFSDAILPRVTEALFLVSCILERCIINTFLHSSLNFVPYIWFRSEMLRGHRFGAIKAAFPAKFSNFRCCYLEANKVTVVKRKIHQ